MIDNFFGTLDKGLDKVEHFFNRADHTDRKMGAAARAAATRKSAAGEPAVVVRQPFRIEEVTDAETGEVVFIVTNGVDKAECSTMALAKTMLAQLEGSAR